MSNETRELLRLLRRWIRQSLADHPVAPYRAVEPDYFIRKITEALDE